MSALGKSGIAVPPLGVGTNKWGGARASPDVLLQTFDRAVDVGLTLFDTAEIYQRGKSEQQLGDAHRRNTRPITLISKFAPYPTRLSAKSLLRALDATLARLGVSSIDLYLVHFPYTLLGIASLMDAMAEAHKRGKIRAVGVSNFSPAQMRRAADALDKHGLPLAVNEVHYSLVHRRPETNGVLETCHAIGASLIAYFPLGSGLLTSPDETASGFGFRMLGGRSVNELPALKRVLQRIAVAHSATVPQVALNWLLQRDPAVIPIPGTTKPKNVDDIAGTLRWRLTSGEFDELDQASSSWK